MSLYQASVLVRVVDEEDEAAVEVLASATANLFSFPGLDLLFTHSLAASVVHMLNAMSLPNRPLLTVD